MDRQTHKYTGAKPSKLRAAHHDITEEITESVAETENELIDEIAPKSQSIQAEDISDTEYHDDDPNELDFN